MKARHFILGCKRIWMIALLVMLLQVVMACTGERADELRYVEDEEENLIFHAVGTALPEQAQRCVFAHGDCYVSTTDSRIYRIGEKVEPVFEAEGEIRCLGTDSGGNLLAAIRREDGTAVVTLGADGVALGQMLLQTEDDFYTNAVLSYEKNTLLLDSDGRLLCYDGEGRCRFSVEDRQIAGICIAGDGVICLVQSEGGQSYGLYHLDLEAGSLSSLAEIGLYNAGDSPALLWNKQDGLLLCTSTGAFECDLDGGQVIRRWSWQEYDILEPSAFALDAAGTFAVLADGGLTLLVPGEAPAEAEEAQTEPMILQLATISVEGDRSPLYAIVQAYNQAQSDVRISIVDYSAGAPDYSAALQKMNTEILAGNLPDLLDCKLMSGMQYSSYAEKGVFLPLDGLIVPEEYLPGVLEAARVDGTLFSITGSFTIALFFGPQSVLQTSMQYSVEDIFSGSVDLEFQGSGGANLLERYCTLSLDKYVDYAAQKTDFESQTFLTLLEYCASIRENASGEGKAAVGYQPVNNIDAYQSLQYTYLWGNGERFCALGIAEGGMTFSPTVQLAVCAQTEHPDEAKAFLQYLLSEACQTEIRDTFPVSYAALRTQLEAAVQADGGQYREDLEGAEFDEAAAADLMQILEHASCRSCDQKELVSVILEEAEPFFAGDKTAAEVAAMMDNRIGLILAEKG